MPFLTVDGVKLHYREQTAVGATPRRKLTTLLLHGAGGSSQLWLPVMQRLGRAGRVIALDLAGHGRSSLPGAGAQAGAAFDPGQSAPLLGIHVPRPRPVGAARSDGRLRDTRAPLRDVFSHARLVVAFARELLSDQGVASPLALVGHSLGGAIALAAALEAPALVARLGLCGTGARLPIDPGIVLLAAASPHRLERFFAAAGFGSATPAEIAGRAAVGLVGAAAEVAEADFRACQSLDLGPRLAEIRVPSLVVIGEDDRLVPPAVSEALGRGLVGSSVVRLPRAGHMMPVEQPDALSQALASFLA